MRMEKPEAILFDLDDTILANEFYKNECWNIVISEFSGDVPDIKRIVKRINEKSSEFWSDPERHRQWRQRIPDVVRSLALKSLEEVGLRDEKKANEIAARFLELRSEHLKPFPGAMETLETLMNSGMNMALITNGASESQREKINRFRLERFFRYIFIEGEHGFGKPEEKVYRYTLERIDAIPEKSWMVGDKLEWEVVAPQRIGMKGVLVRPDGNAPYGEGDGPFLTVRSVSEILDYI